MDWSAFFAAAGLSKQQTFVVWQPGAVKGVAALFASQPLAAWKDYLAFHAIHRNADVLPKAFAGEALALQDAIAGKELPREPCGACVAGKPSVRWGRPSGRL
jgi:predicted metalloendopeptidase